MWENSSSSVVASCVSHWYQNLHPLHPSFPSCYVTIPDCKRTPMGSLFWTWLLHIYFLLNSWWGFGYYTVHIWIQPHTIFWYIHWTTYFPFGWSCGRKKGIYIEKKELICLDEGFSERVWCMFKLFSLLWWIFPHYLPKFIAIGHPTPYILKYLRLLTPPSYWVGKWFTEHPKLLVWTITYD